MQHIRYLLLGVLALLVLPLAVPAMVLLGVYILGRGTGLLVAEWRDDSGNYWEGPR